MSNTLVLNLMKITMVESIKTSMPKTNSAKEFMAKLNDHAQFNIPDKSIIGTIIIELTTKKFD